MTKRAMGHIKQFDRQVRASPICPDDGYPDISMFLSDFRSAAGASSVRPGDAVEFRIAHAPEGPRAVDVVVLETETTAGCVRGEVKWFSRQNRYGFVQRDDGLRDVFVHVNAFGG